MESAMRSMTDVDSEDGLTVTKPVIPHMPEGLRTQPVPHFNMIAQLEVPDDRSGITVTGHIDHDRTCQNENGYLAWSDIDAIRVRPRKPLLRYFCDAAAIASEDVFVVAQISLSFQIAVPLHMNREGTLEEREELLLYGGVET